MRALRWWSLRGRLARIQLLVLDVDGVLTDGGLWFDASGQLIKRFDVRDGLGIRLLQQAGVTIALLSGGHHQQGAFVMVHRPALGVVEASQKAHGWRLSLTARLIRVGKLRLAFEAR